MTLVWQDTTVYSRDDTQRIPDTWSVDIADLHITVTSGHIRHQGKWIMHCHSLGMERVPLKAGSVTDAQQEALGIVQQRVARWAAALASVEA